MTLKSKFNKKIAILGGSGPWASAYGHTRLVQLSQWDYGAVQDQDYPHILHLSVPLAGFGAKGIEDRDAVRADLFKNFELIKNWGADLVVIACNSLHSFYDDLTQHFGLEIIHLPRAGAEAVATHGLKTVGVLCSESAHQDNLHAQALKARGITAIMPTEDQQARINTMIEAVMGGDNGSPLYQELRRLSREFAAAGAQAIISGCTELSWLSTKAQASVPVIDCLNAALEKTLKLAAYQPL